ncbi:MAG: MgtC/SapB family protein [Ruminococcaceae bacterium]|nr:MgtC/SapB family protein [Oscillospiraceae bacterium]
MSAILESYESLEFIKFMRDLNIITVIIRLILAALFGAVIGLERGRQRRAAGLRTHTLVCLGSALTATLGIFTSTALANLLNVSVSDPLRVSAQVISGIGFLGVGSIMIKGRFQIVGLTTAAGLWVTAAIGISLGAGFYEGALVALAVTVFTILVLHKLERKINANHLSFGVYTEINSDKKVNEFITFMKDSYRAHDVQVTVPRSGITGNIGIEVSIISSKKHKVVLDEVVDKLQELDYVIFAIESL